jgi:hypothetical protein
MRGNSHVRFGAGDEETCPGDGARRFIPTLPNLAQPSHSLVPPAPAHRYGITSPNGAPVFPVLTHSTG